MSKSDVEKLKDRYKNKLEKDLNGKSVLDSDTSYIRSVDYEVFKSENLPGSFSLYEKACRFSKAIFNLGVDKKTEEKYNQAIKTSHLNVDATGIISLSLIVPFLLLLLFSGLGFLFDDVFFFIFAGVLLSAASYYYLNNLVFDLARKWRQNAGNQMVLFIFYLVTYMRQNSNFENALYFASTHIEGPLALDFKKVIWDVESGKYFTLQQSLDDYLETWRDYNLEFIESMQLVQSSLMETDEGRRITTLEKSLSIILDETYEKMLHYAHDLQGPIAMLNMLGIVMPIMGLVILPLVVSFFEGVKWYYLGFLYNVLIPIGVFWLGMQLFKKRPVGYGNQDFSEYLDNNSKSISVFSVFKKISLMGLCVTILFIGLIIGFMPQIIHSSVLTGDTIEGVEGVTVFNDENGRPVNDYDIQLIDMGEDRAGVYLLEYKLSKGTTKELIGPYGLGASILSFGIPLALALSFGIYLFYRTRNIVKIRNNAKKVEKEFSSALFQLGNRLGDGMPAEISFHKVATTMKGTSSGKLFSTISSNTSALGQDLETAIFNKKNGAILSFPSNIIESSMRILIQSVKKGPKVASVALMNISQYIKEMHKVEERLKDLLSEVISGMKSQTKFLAPVIAAIVVGITSMINAIIAQLSNEFSSFGSGGASISGSAGPTVSNFNEIIKDGLPTYYFQIIVGIYVVQLIFILSSIVSQIEDGTDRISKTYSIGKNLINGGLTYTVLASIMVVAFNIIAVFVIAATTG